VYYLPKLLLGKSTRWQLAWLGDFQQENELKNFCSNAIFELLGN
jgi:hypothetical protein